MRTPLHLRVLLEASAPLDLLPDGHGVVVLQKLADGRNVLLTAPGRRPPFAGTIEPIG